MCFKAFGMGGKLKLCGVVSWCFGLSGQSNRRIFENYRGVGAEELWDRLKGWSAFWSWILQGISLPDISKDLLAVVV